MDECIFRIREGFPFFQEPSNQDLAYFDSGATALKPRFVLDAENAYYTRYTANIHRAVFDNSYRASEAYENAREKIARFLGAQFSDEIIFTPGTTAAINFFARSYAEAFLKKGDRIVCTEMEHHANLVPWQEIASRFGCELAFVPLRDNGELELSALEGLLTPNTKLLAVTAVSNVLGTINPVEDIARLCAAKGIHTFVDAAQGVLHSPFTLGESPIDFFAFSGHKMFSPTGVGVFYGRRALLKQLPPFVYGGGMVREVTLQKTTYASAPSRFEGGTPPVGQAIALGAAVDYISSLSWTDIKLIEAENLRMGLEIFEKYKNKGISLLGSAAHRAPIFSFSVQGVHPHDAGSFLSEQGIAVRTGHQCAQPLLHRFGLSAVTRASASIYNTSADWKRLDKALEQLLNFFEVSPK